MNRTINDATSKGTESNDMVKGRRPFVPNAPSRDSDRIENEGSFLEMGRLSSQDAFCERPASLSWRCSSAHKEAIED